MFIFRAASGFASTESGDRFAAPGRRRCELVSASHEFMTAVRGEEGRVGRHTMD
jgi:hypothetical protein